MQDNQKKPPEEMHEVEKLYARRHRKGTAERMWKPIRLRFTETYRYVSRNPGLAFLYWFAMIVGMPFAYLRFWVKYRFTVTGRENVRLLKKQSAITVANHVHDMDSPMMTKAFWPNSPHIVALPHNFEVFVVGGLARVLRGIPLPSDIHHFSRFSEQVNELLRTTKRKVHFYPEGEIEPNARGLREFKNGAFNFAVRNKVPVLPMVFVFPAENRVKLIVGKPIYLSDVPEVVGAKDAKQVVLMAQYTQTIMQNMLDEFYGGKQIEN